MEASLRDDANSTGAVDVEKGTEVTSTANIEEKDEEYPNFSKTILIMIALYLSMFLVALDRTILGTAIPQITDDFHSVGDVGWYGAAYLLTSSAFQLLYGRVYTFYTPKWVLLAAIGIFEIGSLICAVAPNSTTFILGRAVAGLGSAGILSGCIINMVSTVPLHKRPIYQGIFGAIFGVSSVAGPLLGGVFTTNVSWRWCFYINLPVGAVVVTVVTILLKSKPTKNTDSLREQVRKLDPLGTVIFLPGIICLLLALQWGGTTYPWSNPRIIALFILGGILLILFIIVQIKSGEYATVPIRIISQRSVAAGVFYSGIVGGPMLVIIYFLPIWFQAIKGVSAVQSGINTLPLILGLVVASILAGAITQKTGYYVGQLIACSIIMSIGAGLLTTLKVNTNAPHWIGYQVLFGFGLGLGMQQAGMAAQTCLAKKDVMTGVSVMFFAQGLGGAIWLSVAQTIFNQNLVSHLRGLSNLDPAFLIHTGATELKNVVPKQFLGVVLESYNYALTSTFKLAVGCAAVTIISGLTMEWRSIKKGKQEQEKSGVDETIGTEKIITKDVVAPAEPEHNTNINSKM